MGGEEDVHIYRGHGVVSESEKRGGEECVHIPWTRGSLYESGKMGGEDDVRIYRGPGGKGKRNYSHKYRRYMGRPSKL